MNFVDARPKQTKHIEIFILHNIYVSSFRRGRPTLMFTAAAWGDHHHNMRTLEADKPAVTCSVPLLWMFLKTTNTDVDSRFEDTCYIWCSDCSVGFIFAGSLGATQSVPALITVRCLFSHFSHSAHPFFLSLSFFQSFCSSGFTIRLISLMYIFLGNIFFLRWCKSMKTFKTLQLRDCIALSVSSPGCVYVAL